MNDPKAFNTAEQCIHERFDEIAGLFPDRVAISDGSLSLTYRELREAADKMASAILEHSGHGQENIAFLISNNGSQIITLLGILKAGKSYVALDPQWPAERNRMILADARCRLLIFDGDIDGLAAGPGETTSVMNADAWKAANELPPLQPPVPAGNNAITLYTSGSTGTPKGVMQSHRNMVHFIKRLTERFGIVPGDRIAYYLSAGFSAHALPLLGALLNGAELVISDFRTGNFLEFSRWFRESKISFAMMIPSFLRHFLAVQDKRDRYPDLRVLLLGGETLYRSDVEKARKVFRRETTLANIYASTEAYLMSSYIMEHGCLLRGNIVPAGYPAEGMELSIVDENGNPVREKQRGEIILRSRYVSEGYWHKPALQEQDFKTDPHDSRYRIFKTSDCGYYLDDGCIVHTGRSDSSIKLRGYRIDLDEIINLLLGIEEVSEAACALKKNPQGAEQLVAWAVPAKDKSIDMEYIRARLVRLLPGYMVPGHILLTKELPKNATGKADIDLLPEPVWKSDSSVQKTPAADATEEALVAIFEKALKLSPIGTGDNFLETGANSLELFVALSEVEKRFNTRIDIDTIIKTPNIRSLATHIRKIQGI
jgi:amino acid adenylation domain-containing protein